LALDRVITEDGPKLLEINARAGLEVQNISDTRLQKILNKIEDLQIQDPQKGVEIGKTLLAREYSNSPEMHKILYLSQDGILKIKDATQTEEIPVVVSIDLNKKKNYISPELYTRVLQTTSSLHIALPENSIILRQLEFLPSDKVQN
jgi:phosphoribosylamine-glycine ligase